MARGEGGTVKPEVKERIITKFEVEIRQTVSIEIDESKFTPEFMEQYRKDFYGFTALSHHVEHLAVNYTLGLIGGDFIEGYGDPANFGIKFRELNTEANITNREVKP